LHGSDRAAIDCGAVAARIECADCSIRAEGAAPFAAPNHAKQLRIQLQRVRGAILSLFLKVFCRESVGGIAFALIPRQALALKRYGTHIIMSSLAFSYNHGRLDARRARIRRQSGERKNDVRSLSEIAVSRTNAALKQPGSLPTSAWWLVLAALVIHLGVVWYETRHSPAPVSKTKSQLAVDLVQPPKVEPPKPLPPPPPRAQPKPQVLPPIQESVPQAAADTDNVPHETVAVAPVVTAPPPPPPPEPLTAAIGRAGYLNNPPPSYPPLAARQHWEGTVVLHIRVLANGRAEAVEIQKSSGHEALDDEAVKTVRTWSFVPSKRGETPIDGWATVPIEFKL
jgi:protein TonB